MQFTTAALFAAAAAAAPTLSSRDAAASSSFTLISAHSGDLNVHLRPVAAAANRLWLNRDTASYCPDVAVENNGCPAGNSTKLGINESTGNLFMSVVVPGGQAAYIAPNGALSYTTAHSAAIPEGSEQGPFCLTNVNGPQGTLNGPEGRTFVACPEAEAGEGVYGLYDANKDGFSRTDCTGVDLLAYSSEGAGAWQYS